MKPSFLTFRRLVILFTVTGINSSCISPIPEMEPTRLTTKLFIKGDQIVVQTRNISNDTLLLIKGSEEALLSNFDVIQDNEKKQYTGIIACSFDDGEKLSTANLIILKPEVTLCGYLPIQSFVENFNLNNHPFKIQIEQFFSYGIAKDPLNPTRDWKLDKFDGSNSNILEVNK